MEIVLDIINYTFILLPENPGLYHIPIDFQSGDWKFLSVSTCLLKYDFIFIIILPCGVSTLVESSTGPHQEENMHTVTCQATVPYLTLVAMTLPSN